MDHFLKSATPGCFANKKLPVRALRCFVRPPPSLPKPRKLASKSLLPAKNRTHIDRFRTLIQRLWLQMGGGCARQPRRFLSAMQRAAGRGSCRSPWVLRFGSVAVACCLLRGFAFRGADWCCHAPPTCPTSHPCHPPPTPATHLPPATHALAAAGGRNAEVNLEAGWHSGAHPRLLLPSNRARHFTTCFIGPWALGVP